MNNPNEELNLYLKKVLTQYSKKDDKGIIDEDQKDISIKKESCSQKKITLEEEEEDVIQVK